jgi:branched-subunit amino acid aminotransferase/4-amino-4-deoxychorismate lyase
VFRLDRHLDRLSHSAELLKISLESRELKTAVTNVITANNLGDARIRITVSPGEGTTTTDLASWHNPTVLIVAQGYQPYPEETYRRGFRAIVSSIRRNSRSPLSCLKSTSYLESMLAKQEARTAGADEALLLNERGFLAETSMSNLFLVSDGKLKTPGQDSGILPGITREAVLELASSLEVEAVECDITPEELLCAGEAFLTSSLIEVMPLTEVDGKPVDSGRPGALTRQFMQAYHDLAMAEVDKSS